MKARIYTKTGDKGETSLIGGTRVSKTHARLMAYGTLDELNSLLGVIRSHISALTTDSAFFEDRLEDVQNNLFNAGSHLACEDSKLLESLPYLRDDALTNLERDMDQWETELPPLREFILPGGSSLAAHTHVARAVCRRAEREVLRLRESTPVEGDIVVYINRLSDWLFLLARKFNFLLGHKDLTWQKENLP